MISTTIDETTTYRNGELASVTREAVLGAIDECDRVGMDAFLETHGYRPSLRYQLRFRGRSYPSKAILGVAAGLGSSEFFGGAAVVVRHLVRLGFIVREGRRVVTAVGLLDLARANGGGPEAYHLPELPTEPSAYFASGSNRVGEIRGLGMVGQDVGVAAPEILGRAPAEAALVELAGTDVQVFVDSGAFSEVEFTKDGPIVVRPIGELEWTRILRLYERLAEKLGSQVWIVAPDRIGDQTVTLARLERYRAELARIAALGARILVPVQKGALSQAEFAAKVDAVLAGIDWLPALPCKKAATSALELAAFLGARIETRHVHLLGLGPTNREAPAYLRAVAAAGVSVSLDSNWITANVGRAGRTTPRRYTWAQDIARKALAVVTGFRGALRELALLLSFGLASVLCVEGGEE